MPYATTAQIQVAAGGAVKLVEVFDWDGDGVPDADVIAQLQTEADSWIDSFVGKVAALPIAEPSVQLSALSASEVVYLALDKRRMTTPDDRDGHDRRGKWLASASRSQVVMSPAPTPAPTIRSAWVSRDTDPVSREGLKGGW